MKIKTIKKTKTTSIVKIENENWGILENKILYFYAKDISYFELDDQHISDLKLKSKNSSWNKLLDFLSYRERARSECKEYLVKRRFLNNELADELIEKAVSLNYINDERFAEIFVEDCIRRNKSRKETKSKLFGKKIGAEIIEKILDKIYNLNNQTEVFEQNYQKAKSRFVRFPQRKRDEKLINFLSRKGFSYWQIKERMEKEKSNE